MLQRSSSRQIVGLFVYDLSATLAALGLARVLRVTLPWGKPLTPQGIAIPWPALLLALVDWAVVLSSFGIYDPHHWGDDLEIVLTTVPAVTVATLAYAGLLYLSYRGLSRLLYVYFYLLDLSLLVGGRLLWRHWASRRRLPRRRVAIVGTGPVAQETALALSSVSWLGVELVGFVRAEADTDDPRALPRPLLGDLAEIASLIARHDLQELIVVAPLAAQPDGLARLAALQELPVQIKVLPDYWQLILHRASLEEIGGLFFIGLNEPVLGPIDRLVKRAFDLVVASIALIALAPLLIALAVAVAVSSPGPILYRSVRVGEGGKLFTMFKFRTMYVGAERQEPQLVDTDEEGRLLFAKRPDDPRVTRIGRFLRRHSLDELPQLWNVLRGEMSLVGPRPELPALVARYTPWQRRRFAVPQGMTGWWQISGRSAKPKYQHVEDDLYYIRHYSLWLDVKILWRTLGVVWRGTGAY